MSPHFVIVSLCTNDFGDPAAPTRWEESCYWLEQIGQFCRTRQIPYLIVPSPGEDSLLGVRDDAAYPGRVTHLLKLGGTRYLYPVEAFADEDLRLRIELRKKGEPDNESPLYNRRPWGDNHFSPLGCALWGRLVAERLCLVMVRQDAMPLGQGPHSPSTPSSRRVYEKPTDGGL